MCVWEAGLTKKVAYFYIKRKSCCEMTWHVFEIESPLTVWIKVSKLFESWYINMMIRWLTLFLKRKMRSNVCVADSLRTKVIQASICSKTIMADNINKSRFTFGSDALRGYLYRRVFCKQFETFPCLIMRLYVYDVMHFA